MRVTNFHSQMWTLEEKGLKVNGQSTGLVNLKSRQRVNSHTNWAYRPPFPCPNTTAGILLEKDKTLGRGLPPTRQDILTSGLGKPDCLAVHGEPLNFIPARVHMEIRGAQHLDFCKVSGLWIWNPDPLAVRSVLQLPPASRWSFTTTEVRKDQQLDL